VISFAPEISYIFKINLNMQYTTQQLQGGPKYSHKTRIGNWNEDMELSGIQRGNYNAKKTGDGLPFSKTLTKYQQSYR